VVGSVRFERWRWESLLRSLSDLQVSVRRLQEVVDDPYLQVQLANFLTSLYDFERWVRKRVEPRYVEEVKPNLRPLTEEDIKRLWELDRNTKVVDD